MAYSASFPAQSSASNQYVVKSHKKNKPVVASAEFHKINKRVEQCYTDKSSDFNHTKRLAPSQLKKNSEMKKRKASDEAPDSAITWQKDDHFLSDDCIVPLEKVTAPLIGRSLDRMECEEDYQSLEEVKKSIASIEGHVDSIIKRLKTIDDHNSKGYKEVLLNFKKWQSQLDQIEENQPKLSGTNYGIHMKLAQGLFDLHLHFAELKKADEVINKIRKRFPKENHPLFTFSHEEKEINVRKNLLRYEVNRKYLKEALKEFDGKVFFKISPFGFGTDLICCKEGNKEPEEFIIDNDASDSEEERKYISMNAKIKDYDEIEVYIEMKSFV